MPCLLALSNLFWAGSNGEGDMHGSDPYFWHALSLTFSDALLRREHVQRGELRRRPGRGRCDGERELERRRRGPGDGPGGEGDAVQGEAEAEALREADPVRLAQGLRRDAAARQGPVRQGARRRGAAGATGGGGL